MSLGSGARAGRAGEVPRALAEAAEGARVASTTLVYAPTHLANGSMSFKSPCDAARCPVREKPKKSALWPLAALSGSLQSWERASALSNTFLERER